MLRRRILTTLGFVILVVLTGTIGYRFIEHWSWLDSIYMTVITLTTVGYGEIRPLTDIGRMFTILVIIGGAGVFAYTLSSTAELISSGELARIIRLNRRIALKDHAIICGYGRVGKFVASELNQEQIPFIVVDKSEEAIEDCIKHGYKTVQGNAASVHTLEKAGVMNARTIITAVNSDAENVFIVLTIRELREDILIISRCNFQASEAKLRKAGADKVISPYALAGNKIVQTILRPKVTQFLDVVLMSEHTEMYMEEVEVKSGSPIAGLTLGDSRLRNEVGVTVLAIDLPDQIVVTHPTVDTQLPVGARLIVMGTSEQLQKLNELVS